MNLPKRNSADGRCYWMKPEVQEELQPLFDQCIQDAIDGRITRLDSLWPPVVVSSEGAPFEVWQLLRAWTEIQRAETLDAEKAIAFSENLRRQSRWGIRYMVWTFSIWTPITFLDWWRKSVQIW